MGAQILDRVDAAVGRRHRARDDPSPPAPAAPARAARGARAGERGPVGARPPCPPREGNALEVLIDGANALPPMAEAIRGAQRHVHVCSWHLQPDFDPARASRRRSRSCWPRPPSACRCACSCGRARPCRCSSPAAAHGQGRARRLVRGTKIQCELDAARPADALPPREARDRRRRDRVRRRHRPDRAGRRPLRLQRAPATRRAIGWHDATSLLRGPIVRDVAAHFALRWEATAGEALAVPEELAPRRRHDGPVRPHRARGRLPTCSRAASSRSWRPTSARCAAREAPDLPREPVPVVAGDRPHPRGQAAQPAARRLPRRGPAPAQGQQRPGRHARDARPARRRRRRRASSFLAATIMSRTGEKIRPAVRARQDRDRRRRSGSRSARANLNEHCLFNDTEVDVVTCDPRAGPRHAPDAVGRAPRARRRRPATPRRLVDELWRPIASEQLERRRARRAADPPPGRAPRRLAPLAAAARARSTRSSSTADQKTTVRLPCTSTRSSRCHFTARASTVRSMSRPSRTIVLDVLAVGDARDVLLDDRAGVELLGDVVRGRADDLHAALERPLVRVRAGEGRQERVVDVDDRRRRPARGTRR